MYMAQDYAMIKIPLDSRNLRIILGLVQFYEGMLHVYIFVALWIMSKLMICSYMSFGENICFFHRQEILYI